MRDITKRYPLKAKSGYKITYNRVFVDRRNNIHRVTIRTKV